MKENKGKEVVDEAARLAVQSKPHPSVKDKRKTFSKTLDLGNLPSCRGKKAKHGLSRLGIVKSSLPTSQSSVQFLMLTHPFSWKSLRPKPLLPPRLNLPRGSL